MQLALFLWLCALTTAEVFKFPLSNGFPNIAIPSPQLDQLQEQANGLLTSGGTQSLIETADSATSHGIIAFEALAEVAFFSQLIQNITKNAPGYTFVPDRDNVLRILEIVLAQEEVHYLNANSSFFDYTGSGIQPCEYMFPVDNFVDAIALASQFADLMISMIPDVQRIFTLQGPAYSHKVSGVGSLLGQKGEQNGYYRRLLNKLPAASPFVTAGAREFTFNAIVQNYIAPGTECPSQALLEKRGLPSYGILSVVAGTPSLNQDTQSRYTAQPVQFGGMTNVEDSTNWSITYINQVSPPASYPITAFAIEGDVITFDALFPGKTQFLSGLTIAAVTSGNNYSFPYEVAADTLFGPAVIEL